MSDDANLTPPEPGMQPAAPAPATDEGNVLNATEPAAPAPDAEPQPTQTPVDGEPAADVQPAAEMAPAVEESAPTASPRVKFRPDLPFGKITPAWNGAHFMQGSEYFGPEHEHLPKLSGAGVDEETFSGPKATTVPEVKPVSRNHLAQQGKINLQAWHDGKEQHHWAHLKSAVHSATGTSPNNKMHAVELLKKHGVIDGDDMDQPDG